MMKEQFYGIYMFDGVKKYLHFNSKDDFYFLQILQRKKENPNLGSDSRVIKSYYIRSYKHLMDYKEEITGLCKFFNARAMLNLNFRSYADVDKGTNVEVAVNLKNNNLRGVSRAWESACGKYSNAKPKDRKYIIDVDYKDYKSNDPKGDAHEHGNVIIEALEDLS